MPVSSIGSIENSRDPAAETVLSLSVTTLAFALADAATFTLRAMDTLCGRQTHTVREIVTLELSSGGSSNTHLQTPR